MRSVLCYGDSNTWGYKPAQIHQRFQPHERWPGVLRLALGEKWMVIEEGLAGRTTVHDDPIEGAEKNGRTYLRPCLQSHRPLDLAIVMLGTNDLKARFNSSVFEISMGIAALVGDIKEARPGPNETIPEILVVSPPPIREDLGQWQDLFQGGWSKSLQLAQAYRRIADQHEVHFFDAGSVVHPSAEDGTHLDREGHFALGNAIAEEVESIGWFDASQSVARPLTLHVPKHSGEK